MDKSQYIFNLENEIKSQGYGEYYTAKCIRYANRLLDNNLPVIFDTKHLALLIGISAEDLVKMIYCQDLFYLFCGAYGCGNSRNSASAYDNVILLFDRNFS